MCKNERKIVQLRHPDAKRRHAGSVEERRELAERANGPAGHGGPGRGRALRQEDRSPCAERARHVGDGHVLHHEGPGGCGAREAVAVPRGRLLSNREGETGARQGQVREVDAAQQGHDGGVRRCR